MHHSIYLCRRCWCATCPAGYIIIGSWMGTYCRPILGWWCACVQTETCPRVFARRDSTSELWNFILDSFAGRRTFMPVRVRVKPKLQVHLDLVGSGSLTLARETIRLPDAMRSAL